MKKADFVLLSSKFTNNEDVYVKLTKQSARMGSIAKVIDIPKHPIDSIYYKWSIGDGLNGEIGKILCEIDEKHQFNYEYKDYEFLSNYYGPTKYIFTKNAKPEIQDIAGQTVIVDDMVAYLVSKHRSKSNVELEIGTVVKINPKGIRAKSFGFNSSRGAFETSSIGKFLVLKNGMNDAILLKKLAT